MRKSYLELQYLEEQRLNQELKKHEEADQNYKLLVRFKSLAITFFIMNLFIIITAVVYEMMIIDTNGMLINFVIMTFAISSLILLITSIFYKHKTLKILAQYYKEQEAK